MRIENISSKVSVRPIQAHFRNESITKRTGDGLNKGTVENFQTGQPSADVMTETGKELLARAVENANHMIMDSNRRFDFSVHEETQTIMVKVIDTENGEVIREIPPEKILDLVAKLWELAGIMVDERV
ncbi:MAG: flagellar protein FlaG [Mahellales bacterium]